MYMYELVLKDDECFFVFVFDFKVVIWVSYEKKKLKLKLNGLFVLINCYLEYVILYFFLYFCILVLCRN